VAPFPLWAHSGPFPLWAHSGPLYHPTCFKFITWINQDMVHDRFGANGWSLKKYKYINITKQIRLTKFRMSGTLASFMASVAFFMRAWIYYNFSLEIVVVCLRTRLDVIEGIHLQKIVHLQLWNSQVKHNHL